MRERTGALVGERLARTWGWKVGDRIPVSSNIFSQKNGSRTWDFTIVGIAGGARPEVDTNFMVFQYAYFDETRSFGKDTIGWMVLQTTSPSLNETVAKTIDQMFANSTAETSTDTEKAFDERDIAQLRGERLVISSAEPRSRSPVGSSHSSMLGSETIARAMATRCCCPPDISRG